MASYTVQGATREDNPNLAGLVAMVFLPIERESLFEDPVWRELTQE